jgi:hypothetical protein
LPKNVSGEQTPDTLVPIGKYDFNFVIADPDAFAIVQNKNSSKWENSNGWRICRQNTSNQFNK